MSFLPDLDQIIQVGRGAAASVVGQTYSVYRLTDTTSNSIFSSDPVLTEFPAKFDKAKTADIENVTFELLVCALTCDNTNLQIGDVLKETGYKADGGQYVLAQTRPLKPSIFVRVERDVAISRPSPAGGNASQQPDSGAQLAPGYLGITKSGEEILTLTNGLYAFASSGSVASVPFGLQPQNRVRGEHKPDIPTQVPEVQFVGFLPFLPGVQILENDIISSDAQDRYVVVQVYQSDDIGLQGYIVILKKMAV